MNKKGSLTLTGIILIVLVVFGGIYFMGKANVTSPISVNLPSQSVAPVPTVTGNAKLKVTSVTATSGFDVDDDEKLILVKYTDADLNSVNDTDLQINVTVARDDLLRDVDGAGYIFEAEFTGQKRYDSWNESETSQVSYIDYSTSTSKFDELDVEDVNAKDCPYRFELEQGSSVVLNLDIDLNHLTDHLNILENQYDSDNVVCLDLSNSDYKVCLQYTRTTATSS
jgi:hypothetical protein